MRKILGNQVFLFIILAAKLTKSYMYTVSVYNKRKAISQDRMTHGWVSPDLAIG